MSIGAKPHDAALLHVSGRAQYTDDLPESAGTLHLAFGLATIAHGRFTELDLSRVNAAHGVVRVLTARDIPGTNDGGAVAHDEPVLSEGDIKFHGQPLFAVIADTHLNARKAARLADVTYTEKPAILTMDQAIADAELLEDPIVYKTGDAKVAINAATRHLAGQVEMGGQEHFYLEGHAAYALPQENGDMLVHCSTQHPTEIQHKVAESLNLPFNAVRVETRRMGGGFGGKESQPNHLAIICAVAAHHTGRPCKLRYDRDDDFVLTGKRHDFRVNYEVGFDTDGRIQGVVMDHHIRCGWTQDLSLAIADRALLHSDNAYHLPAVHLTSYRYRTNMVSATAFRGFGGPQGMFAIERIIEDIARHLDCDPMDVRRVNFYQNGQKTHYGMTIEDSVLDQLCAALVETSDYQKRRAQIETENKQNAILKRGIALTPVKFGISFTLTQLNQAGALVHIYADGSVHLNHGGTEMGQGLYIKVAQVAAKEFGIPLEQIKISAADTAKVPNTSATAASSGSDMNGMAVKAACQTIKDRLADLLRTEWGCSAAPVFDGGMVRAGDQDISFADLAGLAWSKRISLSSTGFYATPKIEWDRFKGRGRPFYYFAYGAACSEVVVDTLTGEYKILRTDILHDVGNSLNPAIDIGQIEGGFVQGAGWLTTEELVWDDQARLRTHAPSTYKIPACSDRPDIFKVTLYDNENKEETIYRSKAVGEPPFMLGISVLSALSHAIGKPLDAPATFERVLMTYEGA
ncbi:MAG: xanthine dehydrogenase molybdopterin binding subunit [Pseudomonadota bacterium]